MEPHLNVLNRLSSLKLGEDSSGKRSINRTISARISLDSCNILQMQYGIQSVRDILDIVSTSIGAQVLERA